MAAVSPCRPSASTAPVASGSSKGMASIRTSRSLTILPSWPKAAILSSNERFRKSCRTSRKIPPSRSRSRNIRCGRGSRMLTLSGITKAYGDRVLFADATLQVNRGDRIGLVGPNGAGKTTLFSIVLGDEPPDEGKITLERGISFGYLPQENAPVGDELVIELATGITPEYTKLRRI